MCTKQLIYKPIRYSTINSVPQEKEGVRSDYFAVQNLTNILVKLANRMERPLGELVLEMREKDLMEDFYRMARPDSGLTPIKIVNRLQKALLP